MTDPRSRELRRARLLGAVFCGAGLGVLWIQSLAAAALGVELLAAAFWIWARAADDARAQVPRWAWLRRPAQALWLAAAIQIVLPLLVDRVTGTGAFELLRWLQAIAVVWAGLELLAALPLARPFSDLPGPLLAIRPWLPAILPAAGFTLLWRHQDQWVGVTVVRNAASLLLLITALLAALRAFGRLQWLVSLRWLLISDSAIAGLLVALGVVRAEVSMVLWLAACGGRIYMLAAELRSASPRRGSLLTRLWRTASWVASTSLSWPMLVGLGYGPNGSLLAMGAAAIPVAITAWVIVGRLEEAPERRTLVRPAVPLTLSHFAALLTLVIGPAALMTEWLLGWDAPWPGGLLALAPSLLAGWGAVMVLRWRRLRAIAAERAGLDVSQIGGQPVERPIGTRAIVEDASPASPVEAGAYGDAAATRALAHALRMLAAIEGTSERLRGIARAVFRGFMAFERRLVGMFEQLGGVLISPARDLHTGDAQEYLLLLVGLSLLALLLPLLQ